MPPVYHFETPSNYLILNIFRLLLNVLSLLANCANLFIGRLMIISLIFQINKSVINCIKITDMNYQQPQRLIQLPQLNNIQIYPVIKNFTVDSNFVLTLTNISTDNIYNNNNNYSYENFDSNSMSLVKLGQINSRNATSKQILIQKSVFSILKSQEFRDKVILRNSFYKRILCIYSLKLVSIRILQEVISNPHCLWTMSNYSSQYQFTNAHTNLSISFCQQNATNQTSDTFNYHVCLLINLPHKDIHPSTLFYIRQQEPLGSKIKSVINQSTIVTSKVNMCDTFINDLTVISLFDIKHSQSIIHKFKYSMMYLEILLTSKSVPVTDIKLIVSQLKFIVNYYGLLIQHRLFRIAHRSVRYDYCSKSIIENCVYINDKSRTFKKATKHYRTISNLLANRLRAIFNSTSTIYIPDNFSDNLLEFLRISLHIDIPHQSNIVLSSYILKRNFIFANFTNTDDKDVFQIVDSLNTTRSTLFSNKFEELSLRFLITHQQTQTNINLLRYYYDKLSGLSRHNKCLIKLIDHYKTTSHAYKHCQKHKEHLINSCDIRSLLFRPKYPLRDLSILNPNINNNGISIMDPQNTPYPHTKSFCHSITSTLRQTNQYDIKRSIDVISQIKNVLKYLKIYFTTTKDPQKTRKLHNIIRDIKFFVEFSGLKITRKLYRLLRRRNKYNYCTQRYLKECSYFRQNHTIFRQKRKQFKRIRSTLMPKLIRLFKMRGYQKLKWSKKYRRIFDLLRVKLSLNLPSRREINFASYTLQRHTKIDLWHMDAYSDYLLSDSNQDVFLKKLEEVSHGILISFDPTNYQQLQLTYSNMNQMKPEHTCINNLLQTLIDHSRCSNKHVQACSIKRFSFKTVTFQKLVL